jgi:sulfate/thiosulfate transport system ATP-binding protein
MSIEVQHVSKTFGAYKALDDVSLTVANNELVALLGPSGSGKTTLLRIIAGLEAPDDDNSQVLFDGQNVARQNVGSRQVGFVFQHYALFKHMTVFENIAFGLRVRPRSERPSKEVIESRVRELLKLIHLDNFGARYPAQLSGGQRQRVALARALAIEPKVLLLDEPFGALDAKVRQGLRDWLRRLHDQIHVTTILVTHDQEEALEVADRVVVMNQARIEQVGRPAEVFHHPQSEFVMDFLGQVNVFRGRVEHGHAVVGPLRIDSPTLVSGQTGSANVYVRPHELQIVRECNGTPALAAVVTRVNPAGSLAKVALDTAEGQNIHVDVPYDVFRELRLEPGEQVYVAARQAHVFSPEFEI